MALRIVEATNQEAPLVLRIMLEAFAEYEDVLRPPSGAHRETVTDVERAMAEGGAVLAWEDEAAVGAARYRFEVDHLYVGRVAVLPPHRGRGIGTALMRWTEALARRQGYSAVQLGVRMSIPRNLTFYQDLGYEVISVAPHPRGPDRVATLVKLLTPERLPTR